MRDGAWPLLTLICQLEHVLHLSRLAAGRIPSEHPQLGIRTDIRPEPVNSLLAD